MEYRGFFKTIADVITFIFYIFVIFLSKVLPIELLSTVFGILAVLLCPFIPRTCLVLKNLKIAMPELSYLKRMQIMFGVWYNLGKFAGEYPYVYSFKKNKIFKYVKVSEKTKSIINKINKSKTGSIIFSAHISNWEMTLRSLIDLGIKVSVVFRKQNNPLLEPKYTINPRKKLGVNMIAKQENAALNILRSIKRGENVIILVDQKDEMNGIESEFFKLKSHTNKSAYIFIKKTMVPLYSLRNTRNRYSTKFELELNEEKEISKIEDEKEFIQALNNTVEKWVRENPEQWFWVHDRWGK